LVRLEEALSGERPATIALSGGSTPKPLFVSLAQASFPWDRVHLFLVDERAVPPSDPQSNYRLAEDTFLRPARFPYRNVHRIQSELRPDVAATRYADEIRAFFGLARGDMPQFDIIHRGMGADAHTASLFPGEPLIDDRESIAAAVYVEKLSQWRITLLPGVLLAARHSVILVTGADKAGALRAVLQEPYDPKQFPAQIAVHHARHVTYFVDDKAAALLD
jgi:6-phosphogluconolactonase